VPDPTHDAQLYIVGELSGEEGPWPDGGQVLVTFLLLCLYCSQLCTFLCEPGFELVNLFLESESSGGEDLDPRVVVAEHNVWEVRGRRQGHFLFPVHRPRSRQLDFGAFGASAGAQ